MDARAFQRFTEALWHNLDKDPRVVGLVALGSMARQDYQPDEWSDHDFFVVTIHGVQEDMRQDLTWLPHAEELVFYFRETDHGLKALFPGGHLVEFAVFNEDELHAARINRYRLLIDKANLEEKLAELAAVTREFNSTSRPAPARRFAEFLMNIFVGVGRVARGERLSGRQFIHTHALTHLLHLLAQFLPGQAPHLLDNLDPFRRFEQVYPELGREINRLLVLDHISAAEGLLHVAERELRPYLNDFPAAAVSEVQRHIARAKLKGAAE